MALRYKTGAAALIQFIIMTVLNFINGIASSIHGCTDGDGCIGTVTIDLMFFLLITFWFAMLSVLGYAAQDRRSKGITQLLLACEILVVLIALFDTRHWPNILGLITSLVDAGLAAWVALLTFRLLRAKGARITPAGRKRRSAI